MKRRAVNTTGNQNLPETSNDDCMTRYSDSPMLDIVLLKQLSYDSKNKPVITLSSGDIPNLVSKTRVGRSAALVRKNTLSIRKNRHYPIALTNHSLDVLLGKYFFSEFAPLIIDEETGRLKTLDGEETDYKYSDEMGVFIDHAQENNFDMTTFTYNLTEEDENECPEEYEW